MASDEIVVPDGQLRITPAQRERALAALRDAVADERLRFEELEQRTPRVLASQTRADLADVLFDLVPGADLAQVVGDALPVGDGPGMRWETPLLIEGDSWWRTHVVQGTWQVPPFLEVIASRGSVRLDFQKAEPLASVIDLVITSSWLGSVTLVVPKGWGVDVTSFSIAQNVTVTSGVPSRPAPGMPRLVVHGLVAGGFTARYPKASEEARAQSLA